MELRSRLDLSAKNKNRYDEDYFFKGVVICDSRSITEDYRSKLEDDDGYPRIKSIEIDEKLIKLQLWDDKGRTSISSDYTNESAFRGVRFVVMIFDVTCSDSFEYIKRLLPEVRKNTHETTAVILIAANTHMHFERKVGFEVIQEFAYAYNSIHLEVTQIGDENFWNAFLMSLGEKLLDSLEDSHAVGSWWWRPSKFSFSPNPQPNLTTTVQRAESHSYKIASPIFTQKSLMSNSNAESKGSSHSIQHLKPVNENQKKLVTATTQQKIKSRSYKPTSLFAPNNSSANNSDNEKEKLQDNFAQLELVVNENQVRSLLDDLSIQLPKLHQKIKKLQQQGITEDEKVLLKNYQCEIDRLTAKQAQLKVIAQSENLNDFYRAFIISFETFVMALKNISTGLLKPKTKKMATFLAESSKFLTAEIPIVSSIVRVISGVIIKLDQKQQKEVAIHFSNLGTLNDFAKLAHLLALELVSRYKDQIEQLMSFDEQKTLFANDVSLAGKMRVIKDTAKESFLNYHNRSYATQLAQYGVCRIFINICNNQLQSIKTDALLSQKEELVQHLLALLTAPLDLYSHLRADVKSALGSDTVYTKNYHKKPEQGKWKLEEIYCCPGFYVVSNNKQEYFSSPSYKHQQYGFRKSSMKEIRKLKLNRIANPQYYDLSENLTAHVIKAETSPANNQSLQDTSSMQQQVKTLNKSVKSLSSRINALEKKTSPKIQPAEVEVGDQVQLSVRQQQESSAANKHQMADIYSDIADIKITMHELTLVASCTEERMNALQMQVDKTSTHPYKPRFQNLKLLCLVEIHNYLKDRSSPSFFSFFDNENVKREKINLAGKLMRDLSMDNIDIADFLSYLNDTLNKSRDVCQSYNNSEGKFEKILNYFIQQVSALKNDMECLRPVFK